VTFEQVSNAPNSINLGGYAEQANRTIYTLVPLAPRLAVLPTVTVKTGWTLGNASGQPTVGSPGVDVVVLAISATGAGFVTVTGNPSNAVTLESNP